MSVGPKLKASREKTEAEVRARTVNTATGVIYTPDMTCMPSGEMDWHVMAWIALAFKELEELRAENKELKAKTT